MNTSKQFGISLVEILVSLVISLFLLGGIVQVYVGNKATFTFTNALAEVQENGRFALDTMSQDLRLSNVFGCIPYQWNDPDNIINNTLSAATVPGFNPNWHNFVAREAIQGTNDTGLNGSDTLTLRGSKPGQANVESPFSAAGTNTIVTDAISTIGAGDFIVATRCGTNVGRPPVEADIMRVTSVLPQSGNSQRLFTVAGNKSQSFQNDTSLIELQTVTYSIAAGASGEPALFRSEFGVAQELVEGIQDMQILYGVDSDNDGFPNQYFPSNGVVPDFQNVVSVRLMLLVRSIDAFVTEQPQTYSFNGNLAITAADNRLRQVFTTTIALRNRVGP